MSIFRDDCILTGRLSSALVKNDEKLIEEFMSKQDQFAQIFGSPKPLNPAALDGQDAPLTPEQSSVTALPFVSQSDEE